MKISAILIATFILTLLSALYIEGPLDYYTILRFNNIVQPIELQLGFPLQWLTARSTWQQNTLWQFVFLWDRFIADFAIYAIIATITMVIYDRTLKHENKPKIRRTYLWASSAILVIFCGATISWTLVYSFFWIRIFQIETALRILSALRFLLGVTAVIFTWFLIKYFKQAPSP